ncbi:MAG: DUF1343 domain-containing protein [Candidatus Aminicenantes bacterium]|nr:DUF1343 domain-containing protein [Candidatus Aminicenantes bacterium]
MKKKIFTAQGRSVFRAGILAGVVLVFPGAVSQIGFPEPRTNDAPEQRRDVRPGVEVFLDKHAVSFKGKSVGLVTNPSGVGRNLESSVSLLMKNEHINLIALYGPEHGIRGNAQAGEFVPFSRDEKYGLPVFSLYGQSKRFEPDRRKSLDDVMRRFDTVKDDKGLEESMLRNVDVILFDIQDVGTRIYTYIATMLTVMEACAEFGIAFVVLDRPNPIRGDIVEGPVLEFPEYASYIGVFSIPLRTGMTIGELALLLNERCLKNKARLTVIPMENWKREMWFDETGLPWVIPSPNMPTLETAVVYPGQVLLEGTNLSEGRGTTRPFEMFGAPWIDGFELARRLNRLRLPGVVFREAWFTPTFSKHEGRLCGGCQMHVTDRDVFRAFRTACHILSVVKEMWPREFEFHAEYFDRAAGTDLVRRGLERNEPPDEILSRLEPRLREFLALRRNHLLY